MFLLVQALAIQDTKSFPFWGGEKNPAFILVAVCSCDRTGLTTQHKQPSQISEHEKKYLQVKHRLSGLKGAIVSDFSSSWLHSEVNVSVLFQDNFTSLKLKADMLSWN